MRARAIYTPKQIDDEIARKDAELYEEHFKQIAPELCHQTLAVVLFVLEKTHGWKGKRLRDFLEAFVEVKRMMNTPTAMNHKFDPLDCLEYYRKKYGIDIAEIVEVEVESRR